jgi:hypothetical protein
MSDQTTSQVLRINMHNAHKALDLLNTKSYALRISEGLGKSSFLIRLTSLLRCLWTLHVELGKRLAATGENSS